MTRRQERDLRAMVEALRVEDAKRRTFENLESIIETVSYDPRRAANYQESLDILRKLA